MKKFAAYFFILTAFFGGRVNASELQSSADIMAAGSWRLSVYGKSAETEDQFDISGTQAIQIPVSGGNSTVFSSANTEVELETESEVAMAALTIRPHHGLHYRFKLGQVRSFKISYSSGSAINELESQRSGIQWGVGARWNVSQNTLVSSAVSLDVSYTQTLVDIDRFQSGSSVFSVNQKAQQDEFQAAVNLSHRFKWAEPYGGLKVSQTKTTLKDQSTQGKVSGSRSGFSPFIGLALSVFKQETITIEASFVDEESISAGMHINF